MTKKQANNTARLYLKALIVNYDSFDCLEWGDEKDIQKIRDEINIIVNNLNKNTTSEVPLTALECIELGCSC